LLEFARIDNGQSACSRLESINESESGVFSANYSLIYLALYSVV